MFGGRQRYEAACEEARRAFDQAQADHQHREAQRRRQVAEVRRAYNQQIADAQREVDANNVHIEELEAGLRENDRHAAGLIPITVPELLRLLRDIVIPPPRRDRAHRLHWSAWRRRHQHRARQAHHRWNAYAETTP